MPAGPSVSVVIVSRQRPSFLRRCLKAVDQLDYQRFEIVVVACSDGCLVARDASTRMTLKSVPFDEANISKARNLGMRHARGDIFAFIDDDAVPEPTWLHHLTQVFSDPNVVQAGGTTLGRNGISVQHAASVVDPTGCSTAVETEGHAPVLLAPKDGSVPRLHGTNMAIRRDVLVRHEGFDPRFAFYMDETDLSYRIGSVGGVTAHVPNAVVHHASGASAFRFSDRTPRRLFEIGASVAVFHQKHLDQSLHSGTRDTFFLARDTWLLEHMQRGSLTPDDVCRLKREMRAGYDAGLSRVQKMDTTMRDPDKPADWVRNETTRQDTYLIATPFNRRAMRQRAAALVQDGHRVTVFDYLRHARFHTVAFTDNGYWLHQGGTYGRELRDEPLWRWATRGARVRQTLRRIASVRARSGQIVAK